MQFDRQDSQVIKGVAILLMIWHHLFSWPQYHPYLVLLPVNWAYYLGRFGKLCVTIYLFLSGYGLFCSASAAGGASWSNSFRRLRKFYVGYWLYFALLVPYGLFALGDKGFSTRLPDVLMNLAGMVTYETGYNQAWWFLSVYLPLLLLFPLIYRAAMWQPFLPVLLGAFAIGIQTRIWEGTLLGGFLFWQMTFMVGVFAARTRLLDSKWILQWAAAPKAWHAFALVALFFFRFRPGDVCLYDFLIAPAFVVSATSLLRGSRLRPVLGKFGDWSMPIWLTHGFFCLLYLQSLVYAPRHPILIFLTLLAIDVPFVMAVERFRRWGDGIRIGRRASAANQPAPATAASR